MFTFFFIFISLYYTFIHTYIHTSYRFLFNVFLGSETKIHQLQADTQVASDVSCQRKGLYQQSALWGMPSWVRQLDVRSVGSAIHGHCPFTSTCPAEECNRKILACQQNCHVPAHEPGFDTNCKTQVPTSPASAHSSRNGYKKRQDLSTAPERSVHPWCHFLGLSILERGCNM